jgi:shikimate kinase
VISIYLKASVATLFERLSRNKSKRPLIANLNDDELNEFIAKHLFDRSYYYNQAQHKVAVDDKTVAETVESIVALLA